MRDSLLPLPHWGGGGGPSKRHTGGTGWYWPPSYSVGVRSPCVFSLLEAHAMGPPCVGPPQLGVVADGNATLGRLITPSLPYWEGDDHQPLSA
jgi:hypothetical protein